MNRIFNPAIIAISLLLLLHIDIVSGDVAAKVSLERVYRLGVGVSGEIFAIHHEPGARVKKGTLLLQLDNKYLQARVEAAAAGVEYAEAEMAEAQRSFERHTELYDEGSLSQVALELANIERLRQNSALKSYYASVALAENQLKLGEIIAPESGMVLALTAKEGERVNQDSHKNHQILFGAGVKVLEVDIKGKFVPLPDPGSTLSIIPMNGQPFTAVIKDLRIVPARGRVKIWLESTDRLPEFGSITEIRTP